MKTPFKTVSKGRNLTDKQRALLSAYYQSMGTITPREAALQAGYDSTNTYHAVQSVKKELSELAEMLLIQSSPKAANVITELMTTKEIVPQANIKLEAAKTLLDRTGLGKREKLEIEGQLTGNLFFIPAKKEMSGEVIDGVYSYE